MIKKGVRLKECLYEKLKFVLLSEASRARIAIGTIGGDVAKWAKFLELNEDQASVLRNTSAFGLVLIRVEGERFIVSFGMGHLKLDSSKFVQDFGLKVVLNSVDPEQLSSADVLTPDETTVHRRVQASQGSNQSVFNFDVERDIMRSLAGIPKTDEFASRVAGSDSLLIQKKMDVGELIHSCREALSYYKMDCYKEKFPWIDQIQHVRDNEQISKLDNMLVDAIGEAVNSGKIDGLHMAFPEIYNPQAQGMIKYNGFKSTELHPDINFEDYVNELANCGISSYRREYLKIHTVNEVDKDSHDCGRIWKVYSCMVYIAKDKADTYVLTGGSWYKIDTDFADSVERFFHKYDVTSLKALPEAIEGETETKYNKRLRKSKLHQDLLCLDKELITPTNARTTIEVCDFLERTNKRLIHIKGESISFTLSHLFNQGMVSARVLNRDGGARDKIRKKILKVQKKTARRNFQDLIATSKDTHKPSDFRVMFAVLTSKDNPKLPFFSLVTFRQAALQLIDLNYEVEFCWIKRSIPSGKTVKK